MNRSEVDDRGSGLVTVFSDEPGSRMAMRSAGSGREERKRERKVGKKKPEREREREEEPRSREGRRDNGCT